MMRPDAAAPPRTLFERRGLEPEMSLSEASERLPTQLGRLAIPAGAMLACLPAVSAAAALLLGAALALAVGNPYAGATRRMSRVLLPAAVVGLGGAMDLFVVARAGATGFGYTLVSIAACLGAGWLLSRAFRVEGRTALLVTIGTAICGGSAIAAAAPVLGAEDHEVSVSLAVVFLLNGVALLLFPPLGHWAGLDQGRFGLWAALAIHDTSSVVGAALQYGQRALEVATSIKLARALWIVPVTLGLGLLQGSRGENAVRRPSRPWFILGFLVVAAVTTLLPALRPAGHVVAEVAKRALVLTLFLVGAGLSRSALRQVGARPLLHGMALWLGIASVSLGALRWGLAAP